MPKPPPRSISGRATPELVGDPGLEGQHPAGGDLEAGGVEDLGADVRVQAEQLEAGRGLDPAYRLERVAGGDREPELLVLVGGGDVLVRVRLDAGGHPDHHPAGAAELAR